MACGFKFSQVKIVNDKILLKLDREGLMNDFLKGLLQGGHRFEPLPRGRARVEVVNCELSQSQDSGAYSQFSEVRCNQVAML
jgi:hypothetical protein